MFTFIICVTFLIGALICYASCYVASKADKESERCWREHQRKNLKK